MKSAWFGGKNVIKDVKHDFDVIICFWVNLCYL